MAAIFKGVFVNFTSVSAEKSFHVLPFSIDGNDYLYLPGKRSMVYQIRESHLRGENPLLAPHQHIRLPSDSSQALGAEFMKIGRRRFLSTTHNRGCEIREWRGSRFLLHQNIVFAFAEKVSPKYVQISSYSFLILPFYYDTAEEAAVYYWNKDKDKFDLFDRLPVTGGHNVAHIVVGNRHCLGFPRRAYDLEEGLNSKIFCWSGSHFVHHQTLLDRDKRAFSMISYSVGSLTYLVVAYHYDRLLESHTKAYSDIYVWNSWQQKFTLIHSFPTPVATHLDAFKIGNQQYLTVANLGTDNTNPVASTIYRVEGPELTVHQEIQAIRIYEMKSFSHRNKTFLAIATADESHPTSIYRWQSP